MTLSLMRASPMLSQLQLWFEVNLARLSKISKKVLGQQLDKEAAKSDSVALFKAVEAGTPETGWPEPATRIKDHVLSLSAAEPAIAAADDDDDDDASRAELVKNMEEVLKLAKPICHEIRKNNMRKGGDDEDGDAEFAFASAVAKDVFIKARRNRSCRACSRRACSLAAIARAALALVALAFSPRGRHRASVVVVVRSPSRRRRFSNASRVRCRRCPPLGTPSRGRHYMTLHCIIALHYVSPDARTPPRRPTAAASEPLARAEARGRPARGGAECPRFARIVPEPPRRAHGGSSAVVNVTIQNRSVFVS